MKKQLIKLSFPVPSLRLYRLEFNNNNWTYVYCFDTTARLTKKKRKEPLIIFGGLQHMTLKEKKKKEEHYFNIECYTVDDLINYLEKQRNSDLLFREEYKQSHKEEIERGELVANKLVLKNKNQTAVKYYIVEEYKKNKDTTEFVGVEV